MSKYEKTCFYCGKPLTKEAFLERGLSGEDHKICGSCHVEDCTGCAQCEGGKHE